MNVEEEEENVEVEKEITQTMDI